MSLSYEKQLEYKASIEDDYPSCDYPTDYVIRLKRGARVMFIRNDNEDESYVNSTLGTVTALDEDRIVVKTDEGKTVEVEKQRWTYYEYHINKKGNRGDSPWNIHAISFETGVGCYCS